MATSGSKTVAVTSWDSLVFNWSAPTSGQSVANNTSIVSWTLKLVSTSSGRIDSSASKNWSVTINGKVYSGTNTVGISNNSTKTLASGATVIKHNDDGTKSFNYSFLQEFNITFSGSSLGTLGGSGSATLNTIARASQPSCVTWPEHTQNVGEFGDEISIHMNRKSSTFTHTVRYAFGSQTGTIATNVGTGTTWVIPLTLMNLIPNATKGSGTIYVDTYNGSTKVGTKSCGFTATVPASVKPSCTVTVTDSTGISTTYGNPVKGLSKFNVVVTPTLAYQSAIKAYSTTANGSKYTAASFTTDFLKSSGTLKVSATVTDKRGRTASASKNMTVLDYNAPNISKLVVNRCNADGSENDQGEHVKVTFSATVTSLNNKNTATYKVRYKKTSATTWTETTISALNKVYTATNQTHVFAADGNSSYDVELSVTDSHDTATSSTSVSTAFTLCNCHPSGTGWRFGGVADKEYTLQNDLKFRQTNNSYAFQPIAFNGDKGYTLLAVIKLTALNVNAPIVFTINRRGAACPMIVYVQFASSSTTTDPDVGSITYEGTNYGAFLVKSATSTWKLYVDNTSGWSNPCLQEWYTTDNQSARMTVEFPSEQIASLPEPFYRATPVKMQSILDFIYPVGSIVIRYDHNDPGTLFGGTWTRITNAFLWACDASGTIGQTGGEQEHTLTTAELPKHTHGSVYSQHADGTKSQAWFSTTGDKLAYGTVEAGGGQAHNNMPPYIQVSVWRRTA